MRIIRLIPLPLLAVCAALATAQTFTLVHVFHGADGARPTGQLTEDSKGNLWGTTMFGGSDGLGAVYKIQEANNKETVLHSFADDADGENPNSGVVFSGDGNLYGTAIGDFTNGFGSVYRLTAPKGEFSVLY